MLEEGQLIVIRSYRVRDAIREASELYFALCLFPFRE